MTIIQYEKTTGKIVLIINTNSEINKTEYQSEIYDVIISETSPSYDEVYVKNNELVFYPEKPDGYYYWDGNKWVIDIDQYEFIARKNRDDALFSSDWTDTYSAPNRLGKTLYQQWQDYRQALRDLPEQSGFPLTIVWPTKPE